MALSLRRFKVIRKWPQYLALISQVLEEKGLKGYLVGSVARGDYDCASDVDLAIVIEEELDRRKRIELKLDLEESFERAGVPPNFPLEIHLIKESELVKYPERVPLEEAVARSRAKA